MNSSGSPAYAFVFVLVIMLSSLSLSHCGSNADLAQQTCSNSLITNSTLCSSVLSSVGQSPTTQVKGLAVIVLGQVNASGADTLAYVRTLLLDANASDTATVKCLNLCIDLFVNATRELIPDALNELQSGSRGIAQRKIVDVANIGVTCGSCFSSGRYGSTLTPISSHLDDMCHLYFQEATVAREIIEISDSHG